MAEKSSPWDSTAEEIANDEAKEYSASDFASYFASMLTNGVIPKIGLSRRGNARSRIFGVVTKDISSNNIILHPGAVLMAGFMSILNSIP